MDAYFFCAENHKLKCGILLSPEIVDLSLAVMSASRFWEAECAGRPCISLQRQRLGEAAKLSYSMQPVS